MRFDWFKTVCCTYLYRLLIVFRPSLLERKELLSCRAHWRTWPDWDTMLQPHRWMKSCGMSQEVFIINLSEVCTDLTWASYVWDISFNGESCHWVWIPFFSCYPVRCLDVSEVSHFVVFLLSRVFVILALIYFWNPESWDSSRSDLCLTPCSSEQRGSVTLILKDLRQVVQNCVFDFMVTKWKQWRCLKTLWVQSVLEKSHNKGVKIGLQ